MGNNFVAQAKAGNTDKVEKFLMKGCDIETRNLGGYTALIMASERGHLNVVKLLVAKGANINAINEFGITSLMLAAERDHPRIVKLLLDKGADLNIVDMTGRTVSSVALKGVSKDLVKNAIEAAKAQSSPMNQTAYFIESYRSSESITSLSSRNSIGDSTPRPSSVRRASLLEIQRDEITVSERLCIGIFSVVYEGQWRCSNIALKVLRCVSGGAAFESLEAELDLLSQLRHPRILTLMGVCTNINRPEGNVALVMERMEQGSLYNILHDSDELLPCTTLNYMKRIRLAVDIADGMRFLHHSGVVHKDLRSGHVLVGSDGRAKISDFGLARYTEIALRTTDPRLLLSRTTAFPVAWSAPELIRGDAGITHAIDSFSFGVIIWELLTGEIPWKSMSIQQITAAVGYGKRLSLSARTTEDFPDVSHVMAKCFLDTRYRPAFSDLYNELSLFLTEIIKLQEAKTKRYIPDTFICCIGYEVMQDPVICADGHSYERDNIVLWLKQSNHSPRTNLLLPHKMLIPNYALKELIEDANLR